ncbi:efflux RND transporter permease subunit [Gloeobacter morelensis]|uniref:efflux RND transporter permease subunit n=1 Tax=Gloeobacter morelensis TaxID=2907343 RepID=UPI00211ADCCE|nr:efflux RND transporter permease subunit [Gloeobacter morelensis]
MGGLGLVVGAGYVAYRLRPAVPPAPPAAVPVKTAVVRTRTGRIFVRLKPRAERPLGADQVLQKLRPQLAKVPGIKSFVQNPPTIPIGAKVSNGLYQYTLQSPDAAGLYRVATALEAKLRTLKELQDVSSDLLLKSPQLSVAIDRDRAATLGVSAAQIESALGEAYGFKRVSLIYGATNQYYVILGVEPAYQGDPATLSRLYVRSTGGNLVSLDALVRRSIGAGPLAVNHLGQFPAVTISFNLRPDVSLSQATAKIQAAAQAVVPASVSASFQGTAQEFQSSITSLGVLLVVAILVIYIVLGVLYESYIHPVTILSGACPRPGSGHC